MAGQAGAVRLGIARALEKSNGELRQPLKDAGHLSRDPRKKNERNLDNPGLGKSSNSANANYYNFQAPPVETLAGLLFF